LWVHSLLKTKSPDLWGQGFLFDSNSTTYLEGEATGVVELVTVLPSEVTFWPCEVTLVPGELASGVLTA
jgi:hypothetical protein